MAAGGRKIDDAGRLNSLGLTHSKLDAVLDKLDGQTGKGVVRRVNARWPFREPSVQVVLTHPGGSQVEVQMACRNLSTTGAGLLHSAYLYQGTPCVCTLPHPERGPISVEGEVVRCEHRGGVVHEIGVRFNEEINLRSFVNPDPLSQLFATERVNKESLEGRVLHVEPNEHDANLLRHFLKDTRVRVVNKSTADAAIAAAHEGVDLIISEFTLGGISGADFAVRLRSENISKPLVFLTHDISPRVISAVKGRAAQALIRKPVSEETLLPALAEFLRPGETDSGTGAAADVDPALVESLKPELARCARQIEQGVRDNKPMEVIGSCHVLQQVAGVIGMVSLSESVAKAVQRLSGNLDLEESGEVLSMIIQQCRNAA
jgi:CheY-like chemotaxis protein